MKSRTRILIRIDGTDGATLTDNNKAVEINVIPDNQNQIIMGKKYLMYLTKVYKYGLAAATAVNEIGNIVIDGLASDTNNLNLNSTVQKMAVIGVYNLLKNNVSEARTQVAWENPHAPSDGIVVSNVFNKRLLVRIMNVDGTFISLESQKYFLELMLEEICDC